MLPLADVLVTEAASVECPFPIRLAIALCGRMTSDLGAQVAMTNETTLPSSFDEFLNVGKRVAGPARPTRVLLSDRFDAAADAAKTQVVFTLFPDGWDTPPSSELTLCAMGGLLDIVGDPKRAPLRLGGRQLAYAAALSAYAGLAAALSRPDRETATTIDVNLLDVALWLNWKSVAVVALGGAAPTRAGSGADWQVVRCADGWMAIVYQEKDWQAFVGLVGDPRLGDPSFASATDRLRRSAEIASIVQGRFMSRRRDDIFRAASAMRLPLGPVWTMSELLEDPQNTERAMFARRDDRFVPALPVLWNGARMPDGVAA